MIAPIMPCVRITPDQPNGIPVNVLRVSVMMTQLTQVEPVLILTNAQKKLTIVTSTLPVPIPAAPSRVSVTLDIPVMAVHVLMSMNAQRKSINVTT